MSECPTSDIKSPELKDLVIALKDLVECHALGLQLGLPESTLKLIDKHHDSKEHLRMMLSEWLQFDTEASWEKLAAALNKIGKNAIADNVRREFLGSDACTSTVELSSSPAPAPEKRREGPSDKQAGPSDNAPVEQDVGKRLAMTETVLRKIRSQFSLLVIKVRSAMQRNKIDALDVHQFLVTYFEGECSIPEVPDFTKIFNAMTTTKLWRYDHYGALEEIAESFLPEDDPARAQMTEYKSQLTGFQATTRIIDFVKLNELEDREDISQLKYMFSPKKYNRHYQKLTVELRLERDISELTLLYAEKLWKVLMKEFHLPPLTAVMDKIVEGSLSITWLILPHIIEKIRTTYFKSVEFFQQCNIIRIVLYSDDRDFGLLLYDEESMVTGSTPLYRASFAGKIDKVKNLLEGGANVNEANDNAWGSAPLMGACRTGQADIAKLLLEHKANVDYCNMRFRTSALNLASDHGHTATVMVLLKYGAQVDLFDETEVTPLIGACIWGSTATARVLLEHGAHVDHQDENGWSALMWASLAGQQETVAALLEYRAQVNLVDKYDKSALAYAVLYGRAGVARLLLENGAIMDFEDEVWNAIKQGFSEVVVLMLEFRVPVNLSVTEDDGNTALCMACANGQAETARVLLNHRANLDYQNMSGQSAVHLASMGGHTETLKVLIEKQPQLNLQDQNGWTPLLFAVKQRYLEIIKLLLEHGAAADIETKSGLTALKLAQSEGQQDVCDILLQYTQGSKVMMNPEEESELRQEKTKADPHGTEEQMKSGIHTVVMSQPQGADDGRRTNMDDSHQEMQTQKHTELDTQLNEEQQAELKSVGERMWEQIKRAFLRERATKELVAQMKRQEEETAGHIIEPTKQRRSIFDWLFPWRGRRTRVVT